MFVFFQIIHVTENEQDESQEDDERGGKYSKTFFLQHSNLKTKISTLISLNYYWFSVMHFTSMCATLLMDV